MFQFTTAPDPISILLPYGTEFELSGLVTLHADGGSITLTTPRVVVASLLSIPFSLSGTLHGQEVFGSGIVTAFFADLGTPGIPETQSYSFDGAVYRVATPEPGTLLLLAAGSLFVVRKRKG